MLTHIYFMLLGLLLLILTGMYTLFSFTKRNKLHQFFIALLATTAVVPASLLFSLQAGLLRIGTDSYLDLYLIQNVYIASMTLVIILAASQYSTIRRSTNAWLGIISFPVLLGVGWIIDHYSAVDLYAPITSISQLMSPDHLSVGIYRIVLLVIMIGSFTRSITKLLKLLDHYQTYIWKNQSDPAYNPWSMRRVIHTLVVTFVSYLLLVCWQNAFTMIAFAILSSMGVIIYIDSIVRFRFLERKEDFKFDFDIKTGLTANERHTPHPITSDFDAEKLKDWIRHHKPYLNQEFSAKEIEEHFPAYDYHSISAWLSHEGHTFQSYVRHLRIIEAQRILTNATAPILISDLAHAVGFTHSSLFSHDYTIEVGITPSETQALLHPATS